MPRFFFLIMYYRHLEAWLIQLRNADHGVTDTRIVLLSAKYRQLRFFNAIFWWLYEEQSYVSISANQEAHGLFG